MIRFDAISFHYQGQRPCIQNMTLGIRKNQCIVLTGPSGNGKTSLIRLLNGLAPAYYPGTLSGDLLLQGQSARSLPQWERARLTGSVFQDPRSQFFSDEIEGEIAFACENFGFPAPVVRARTRDLISEMRLTHLMGRPIDRLSSGEKQRVAIASARALAPEILVFDEPSSNLDDFSAKALGKTIMNLIQAGHTLVIAEHRLSYLADVADGFAYIRNGRLERLFSPAALAALPETDKRKMGLRSLSPLALPALPRPDSGHGQPSLAAEGISYSKNGNQIIDRLSLCLYPGQITALTGKNGAGKTTLARILCGLTRERQGRILFNGRRIRPGQRYKTVWYGANDTHAQFFTASVLEELMMLSNKKTKDRIRARQLLSDLGLAQWEAVHPAALSGGQRQRLSIACGLMSGRETLIFDEPTSGLDSRNMEAVSRAFRAAASLGKTLLIITHDAELVASCCTHRIDLRRVIKINR